MIPQKEANAVLKKFKGNKAAAARSLNMPRSTFIISLKGGRYPSDYLSKQNKSSITKGKSITEFKKQYNRDEIIPQRIRDTLKAIGDTWEYEYDFCKKASVSVIDIAKYRDNFLDYVVCVPRERKRIWVGSIEIAKQMREMI